MKTLFLISLSVVAIFFGLKAANIEPWKDKPWVSKLEPWTNIDGKTVELKLTETKLVDGELVGVFYTAADKMVEVRSSQLSEESASRLKECKPSKVSVYDKYFKNDLLKLEGDKLTKAHGLRTPKKYYVFYYTASWCPPCQKFTPSLVKFYNSSKTDDFEIVLISSDSDEIDMSKYAASKKMPWPQLRLSKVSHFKKEFPNGLKSIPSIMVTDIKGKIITKGNAFSVMPSLKEILSK